MPKSRTPVQVGEFTALPVVIPSKALGKDVEHYIYLKAYEPKIPDELSPRALLLVNIPVTATEAQIRQLLTTQLGGGHVQTVHFASQDAASSSSTTSALIATTPSGPSQKDVASTLGKRKRPAQESSSDIANKLSTKTVPSTTPTQLHVSGSTAIAVFLDRASRDLTLRACAKLSRAVASGKSKSLVWSAGHEATKQPPLGLARYQAQRSLTFPPRADLLRLVDQYMTTYGQLEEARNRESAKKRAEPDEDGFITVTRGTRGVVKTDEADAIKQKVEEKKKKEQGLEDFYRFQTRQRRKEEAGQLVRRFEDDRRRVKEMGNSRRSGRPE
ncbi:hypothetical protein LTS08_007674 [Lithohypha guttulata]|nr:hypothetical protein LTS08_007674 [Lithohypha guttulata]